MQLEKNDGAPFWRLLNIFAYGRYSDYKGTSPGIVHNHYSEKEKQNCILFYFLGNKESLPELSFPQIVKLRHLTIISLASQSKVIRAW